MDALNFSPPSGINCRVKRTAQGWLLVAGRDSLRKTGTIETADNWQKLEGLTHRTLPKFSPGNSDASHTALLLPEWASEASKLSHLSHPLETATVMRYLRNLLSLYRTLWMRDLHIPLLSPADILYDAEHLLVLPFQLQSYRLQTPEPPAEPADFCFASPELMEEPEQVGPASGVYNLGMLGLFMLQPAALNTSGLGMSQLLQWKRPPVPMNIDAEAARLLVSMLQKDRSMRPGGPDAIYVEIDRCCDRLEAAQATNTSVKIHEEVFEIRTESDIPVKETEAIPKKQEEKPIQTQIRDRQERQLPETETRVKTCIKPGCDTEMQASAVFCRICGTYQQPAGNRICPHCGAAVPAGLSYCNQCERVLNA
ncbi:MAG: hypothetical protein ACOVSS_12845 [Bacteroidia bacterium]